MSVVLGIILVGVRINALLMTAPVLGHRSVPIYVKLLLTVVITLAAAPLIVQQPDMLDVAHGIGLTDLVGAMVSEILIGGLLGFGALIIFSAAQMVGVAIGQMSGLQLDSGPDVDPSSGQLPVERLIGVIAMAMFVLVQGPELLISSILDSFAALPVGSALSSQSMLDLVASLLAQSFEITALAIAPAVASLLISTIVVGMLMRTLPQLNLIQLGLSSNIAMMLLALMLTLGGCLWMIMDDVQMTIARITDGMETLAQFR